LPVPLLELEPDTSTTPPPEKVLERPACTKNPEPDPLSVGPTRRLAEPATPRVELPVTTTTEPVLPEAVEPECKRTTPESPADSAEELTIETTPEPELELEPLARTTEPL